MPSLEASSHETPLALPWLLRPSGGKEGAVSCWWQVLPRWWLGVVLLQRGTTQLAADRGRLFQHGWNHLVRYNIRRQRERHPWSADLAVAAPCEGKQREKIRLQQRFGVVSNLGVWGIFALCLGCVFEAIPECELGGGCGMAPAHEREESNGESGEAPHALSCSESMFLYVR